jgi:PEP-CTERM motif
MKLLNMLLSAIGILLLAAIPASAGRIDIGGSGYGVAPNDSGTPGNPVLPSATAVSNCAANIGTSNNCEAFNTTSFTIPVDGTSTSITGGVFAFVQNSTTGEEVDVYQLPFSVSAGDTVSLTFENLTANFGAFACDNGTDDFATDSIGNTLQGLPCTVGTASGLSSFSTESESGDTAKFTFLAGAPSTWVFYSDDADPLVSIATGPGSVSAPEPGTFALLGLGLLGVIARRRRLAQL